MQWDPNAKRKLIKIWAERDGRKDGYPQEGGCIQQQPNLNAYVEKELNKTALYTEGDVHNKIDFIIIEKREAILPELQERDDRKEVR